MGSSPQQQQHQEEEEMNLTEPLLRLHPRERNGSTTTAVGHSWLSQLLRPGTAGATAPNSAKLDCSAVTAYSRAGVLSRATFSWLNPLVKLGSLKTLQKEDVPQLAPQHRAARLHSLFHSHWREEGQETTVLHTLWSCFWGNILYTAFLALVKVGVTFVGPLLIQSFVDFCTESPSSSSSNTETRAATTDSRSKSSTWTQAAAPYSSSSGQGLLLVAILVAGKGVEVLFTHQYNFTCQKLGMQIRSALITAVYAKGLRLSSESRQRHGVGQIVNYMSVDAQQMSDVMIHLHTLWAVPLQTAVAIAILARVVGRSATLAGLLALSFTASMILAIARVQRKQQECIMQARDRRMRAFNESLTHMKVIKLQGWEEIFLKGVEDARRIEYMWLLKYVYSTAINILALWLTPLLTCVAIFSACIYFNDMSLAPGMAFTTVATVRTMEEPMRIFPQALIAVSQALVSLDRLDKYLWSKELEQDAVVKLPSDSDHPVAVKVECAFFKWDSKEEKATLSNINLAVNRGSFVTVVGKVGAGKSSLIASLLGEMPKLNGTVELRGSVAYVPQSPWIQHGTIEENILFGLPMDRERYDDTLQACALGMDIAQLDYGDQTEIGERGINLSGGQKQRIQLARAVYQNCDIYLLDDIFSALDAHTGSKIFQECVIEALIGKTVILVTHQIEFLHRANLILVMRDGTIVQSGTFEELSEAGLDFKDLVKAHSEALEKVNNNNNNNNNNSTCDLWEDPYKPSYLDSPHLSTASFSNLSSSCESISYLQHLEIPCSSPQCEEFNMETADLQLECNPLPFNGSLIHQFRGTFRQHPTTITTSAAAQIIGCEERVTGQVSRDIYWLYLTATYGGAIVILLILVQFVWQMFQIASDYWIAYETSESESPASKHPATAGKNFQAEGFIRVYAMLALGCAVCVLIRSLLVAFIGITTSQKFYDKMLHSVFRAPMSFFDTTPLGRVLSRASTDQAQMDTLVPILSGGLLAIAFATTGILVVMVGVTWQLILIIIPLSWIYYSYQVYYLTTSRELTRVDALTKAPVIQHFSETIAGSMTIRCFGHQERFAHVNLERVDQNLKMDFHNNAANEWIGFRLESIGTFVLSFAAFLLVSLPSNLIQTELVGLYLSYALFFNARLFNMVMLVCQLEKSMVSVERINQYTQLESEAPLIIQNSRPPKSWPSKGTIEFRDLKLRYRENTPLVLKGVTVTIKGGRKVGIVGRTGSGKSTLVLALFRLVEPADGCILIDGIDIGTLGLSDLRANLSIIPQDPTLFNGTIRSNLDPMGLYSDQQIWEALQKCQLASSVQQLKAKLETSVLENGENWSVGQRQLFCLGRALLKDTQILVLDEATASVDAETDALILKTVQEVFASRTVISIAHRIPTVMNSDKVLVLDAGKVKEYASPSKLLQDSTSMFASLVSEYSTRSSCSTSDLTAFDEFLPS